MRGVRLGPGGWQREAAAGPPVEPFALVRRADAMGFDSAWFNELHFRRSDLPYPSAMLLASAVLAQTERLRVGISLVVLPIHHPFLLAEELAQLDNQSGGRLDVGIGRGFPSGLERVFPMSNRERRERFEEAYRIILAAWTEGALSSVGPYWPFANCGGGAPAYSAAASDSIRRRNEH